MGNPALPIESQLPELLDLIRDKSILLVQAEPGAGKTTRVPLAILKQTPAPQKILMLEPRRVAAIGAAEFMSELLAEKCGETIGYRTRGATKISARTRLEVVTEGILTRMLLSDPTLSEYTYIIFDEFHERSIHSDLGLALCLESQSTLRADMRIVVMSATLEVEKIAQKLPHAGIVRSPGRSYPVSLIYHAPEKQVNLEENVARLSLRALRETEGDILVFLPGMREIRHTHEILARSGLPSEVELYSFSSETPLQEQRRLLRPQPHRRRIILATNIAETSVTIEGICAVVDSGYMRISEMNHARGMSELVTVRVSKASATQRAGRAGRTAPGRCYRMWREEEHAHLADFTAPEILRADLASFVLDVAVWGPRTLDRLLLLDSPPSAALAEAEKLLTQLEALDRAGIVTTLGKEMSALGVHPRIARMLLGARALGYEATACDLAALLEERDPLRSTEHDVSLYSRWQTLQEYRDKKTSVQGGTLSRIAIGSDRLRALLRVGNVRSDAAHLGLLTALAFPDRIAKRRGKESSAYLLASGSGAVLPPASLLSRHEYLAVAMLSSTGQNARIHLAEPLGSADIETLLERIGSTVETTEWNAETETVRGCIETRIGALVVRREYCDLSDELAYARLKEALQSKGLEWLEWSKEAQSLCARAEWARKSIGQVGIPDLSKEHLRASVDEWLFPFAPGIRSLAALKKVDLYQALCSLFPRSELQRLEHFAPPYITLVTGTRAWIDYSSTPSISVALQEMFGTTSTPHIADGKIPLTIELLSPAKRPLQVTKDLASFWKNTYPKLWVEMRSKYPRHAWPENPLESAPVRGPIRKTRKQHS